MRNENHTASKNIFPISPSGHSDRKHIKTMDKGRVESEYKMSPKAMLTTRRFELVRNRLFLSIATQMMTLPQAVKTTSKPRQIKPNRLRPCKTFSMSEVELTYGVVITNVLYLERIQIFKLMK
jgi:hypothetical protein